MCCVISPRKSFLLPLMQVKFAFCFVSRSGNKQAGTQKQCKFWGLFKEHFFCSFHGPYVRFVSKKAFPSFSTNRGKKTDTNQKHITNFVSKTYNNFSPNIAFLAICDLEFWRVGFLAIEMTEIPLFSRTI